MRSLKSTQRAVELHTERLRMRRVRPADLDAVHGIMSDPAAMRFWSSPPHSSLTETEVWFESMLAADHAQESDEFIIEHLGIVIGKLGAWRMPEVGFFLRRDCWGKGFATEALDRYIAYCRERGLRQLTADVDPRNAACLRVLAKCGFVETGRETATYIVDGRACDSVFLQLDLETTATGGDF